MPICLLSRNVFGGGRRAFDGALWLLFGFGLDSLEPSGVRDMFG